MFAGLLSGSFRNSTATAEMAFSGAIQTGSFHFIIGDKTKSKRKFTSYTRVRFCTGGLGTFSCSALFRSRAYDGLGTKVVRTSVRGYGCPFFGGLTCCVFGSGCSEGFHIRSCGTFPGPSVRSRARGAGPCDLLSGPANVSIGRKRALIMVINSARKRGVKVGMRGLSMPKNSNFKKIACPLCHNVGGLAVAKGKLMCIVCRAGALRSTRATRPIGVRFTSNAIGNCFSSRGRRRRKH